MGLGEERVKREGGSTTRGCDIVRDAEAAGRPSGGRHSLYSGAALVSGRGHHHIVPPPMGVARGVSWRLHHQMVLCDRSRGWSKGEGGSKIWF